MKKSIFSIISIAIAFFAMSCTSKKKMVEVTDSYTEQIKIEQSTPEEAPIKRSKVDNPEVAPTPTNSRTLSEEIRVEEPDGTIIIPAQKEKKTISPEQKEKIKQEMREKIKKQRGG